MKYQLVAFVLGAFLVACSTKGAPADDVSAATSTDAAADAATDTEVGGPSDGLALEDSEIAADIGGKDVAVDGATGPDAAQPNEADGAAVPDSTSSDAVEEVSLSPCATATCGDGQCTAGCETYGNCSKDCPVQCGDGACSPGENPSNCKEDCCGTCGDGKCIGYACGEGDPSSSGYCPNDCAQPCGNGLCEPGETPAICPQDCLMKACGNHTCEKGETPENCKADCASSCGDWQCNSGESYDDCPVDCGFCGDGVCSPNPLAGENTATCPQDCTFSQCNPKYKGQLGQQCGDDNPCTDDSCSALGKCLHAANTAPCSDGNACTTSDACADGTCGGGPAPNCQDGNPCTQDLCDSTTGCEHPAEVTGTTCDDGNACSSGDVCGGGVCGGGPVDCNDNNLCTGDSCDKVSGCAHLPLDGTPCDDANVCTVGDACQASVCKPGGALSCEDANPCTTDACDATKGCTHATTDGEGCDDGSPCTSADQCLKGQCTGVAVVCDDANVCTADSCKPSSGCVSLPVALTACDDGNICTVGDQCVAGLCKSAGAKDCNDNNVCTLDLCDAKSVGGCQHANLAGPCDDGLACTFDDSCNAASCKGKSRLGIVSWFLGNSLTAHSAAALNDGGFVVTDSENSNNTGNSAVRVNRFAPTGVKTWTNLLDSPTDELTPVATMAQTGSGNVVVCSNHSNQMGSGVTVDCTALNDTGAVAWKVDFAAAGWTKFDFAVASPSDALLAATSNGPNVAVIGLDSKGKQLWSTVVAASKDTELDGLAATADGGSVAAGMYNSTDCWVAATNSAGVKLWNVLVTKSGMDQVYAVSALAAGGGYLVVGDDTMTGDPRVIELGPDGKVVTTTVLVDSLATVAAMRLGKDGTVLLSGYKSVGVDAPWMARLDSNYNVVWQQVKDGIDGGQLSAVVELLDGGALGVGYTGNPELSTKGLSMRSDKWGNLSCDDAGACYDKALAACNDNNPCTADICNSGQGCVFSPIADDAPCGADKTCQVGLCK